jgi:glycosyltransferase involved in cell wall biosynthesis
MWNNSANKFFDALAAGRPVALNHGGWQADLLAASGAGVVLPVSDIATSARILVEKAGDPAWVKDSGRAAQHLARERFDRGLLVKQLESVLLEVVGNAGEGG